jgi:predicted RNA-binding Zn-ribbon protein involved in translation (DUF1610 family)
MKNIDQLNNCPECGVSWILGDIPKEYHQHYSPPYVYKRLICIEIIGDDQVSAFQCPDCQTKWSRDSEEKIS